MVDRLRKHNRWIENITIPSSLLRKGVNVLALEIHRSAYPSEYIEALVKRKGGYRGYVNLLWSTCSLTHVQLSALKPQGLEPNVFRPQGFQVWNSDLLDRETGEVSYENLPQYSNKEASLKIWQPLITELKQNLKKRGLEKAVMLGTTMDRIPTKEVVSYFKELLPEAPWVRHAHSTRKDMPGLHPLSFPQLAV